MSAHIQYKLTVGNNLKVGYAGNKEYAKALAKKYATQYPGETVVAIKVPDGDTAFTFVLIPPGHCENCE